MQQGLKSERKVDKVELLFSLIKKGNCGRAKALLKSRKLINVKDKNGNTLLHLAAQNGDLGVVKYLIFEGRIEVNTKNSYGWTPLHYAAHFGYIDVVKYLVEVMNANINLTDERGLTPLHLAAKTGSFEVIEYLTEREEVAINAVDKSGSTALHFAAASGYIDIFVLLILRGADPGIRDNAAKTAIEYLKGEHLDKIKDWIRNLRLKSSQVYENEDSGKGIMVDASHNSVELEDDLSELPSVEKGVRISCSGKYKEALEIIENLLKEEPSNSEAWYYRGQILNAEAIESFRRAFELKSTAKIGEKRMEYSEHFDDSISNTQEQRRDELIEEILDLSNTMHYIVIGKAGTGKSTLIREVVRRAKESKINVVVLAPTGLAAVNIGGQTIHSFFQLPPRLLDRNALQNSTSSKLERICKALELLIIDEVSMVRSDLMNSIDMRLRQTRRDKRPFGGVKVVMVGDLYQLPPVTKKNDEKEYLKRNFGGIYFFCAPVFKEIENNVKTVELTHVFRQVDPVFIDLLSKIRSGCSEGDLKLLNSRVRKDIPKHKEIVVLVPTNDIARRENLEKLEMLKSKSYVYTAQIEGKFDMETFPTESSLKLKKGAQVMIIRNDENKRWVNGTVGIVENLEDDSIMVNVKGHIYDIPKAVWSNIIYEYDEKKNAIQTREIGRFIQYPLKLAWAMTIHKSQGLTLEKVYLKLAEKSPFSEGQLYVALSRCTSLDGIFLDREIVPEDIKPYPEELTHFIETHPIIRL